MPSPEPTTIRADKRFRAKVLVAYTVVMLLMLAALQWELPAVEEYLKGLNPQQALAVIEAAVITAFLSVVPLGIYLWSLGLRIARSRQFPPPGMKVIRDMALTTGAPAMFRGKLLVFLALLLIILGLAGAVYAHVALSGLAGVRHVGQVL